MKKTKIIITAFAVFASLLMLMTSTIAQSVQEKASLDVVEQRQDVIAEYINNLFENNCDVVMASHEIDVLIEKYAGFNSLSTEECVPDLIDTTDFESIDIDVNMIQSELTMLTRELGTIDRIDGNSGSSGEADWAGFMRNMDGDIYVPGEGWISPDDPNYGYWLMVEDFIQGWMDWEGLADLLEILIAFSIMCGNIPLAFLLSLLYLLIPGTDLNSLEEGVLAFIQSVKDLLDQIRDTIDDIVDP